MADPAAGAGGVPMAPAPVAPGVVVPVAVAAAPPAAPPARSWPKLRLRWAQMLFILGCTAAALAAFSLNYSSSPPALGGCAPTVAEVAALRAASEKLLLAAAAQVLGATTAVLLPGSPVTVAIVGTLPGSVTGYIAGDVLFMLVACHGELHGGLVEFYSLFSGMLVVVYLIGGILALCPCY